MPSSTVLYYIIPFYTILYSIIYYIMYIILYYITYCVMQYYTVLFTYTEGVVGGLPCSAEDVLALRVGPVGVVAKQFLRFNNEVWVLAP